jgi:hypothetical protein
MIRKTKRRGIGTTLGIIFFLGILFSTIFPLQLYIKENDIHTLRTENEMLTADTDRDLEDLDVSAYPTNTTSDKIMVNVKNIGPISSVIQRLWINEDSELVEESLYPGDEVLLGPFTVDLVVNTSYLVKVSTRRGRLFKAYSGSLEYIDGTWYTPSLGISVQIRNEVGKYFVEVSNSTWCVNYSTQGQDQDDVLIFFAVNENGFYTVDMRKNSETGPHLPGSPMMVQVMYPNGPPVVYVYTSGLED